MRDVHQETTDKILAQMEKGTLPWQRPWTSNASFELPRNGTTDRPYHGINIPLLWIATDENGFESNEWGSFNQWSQRNEKISKGSKGTQIIYFDVLKREQDEEIKEIPYIKTSVVFNRCQLQGYKPQPREERPLIERLEQADHYILNTGAMIYHDGGNRAFYNRLTDDIHLPQREDFTSTEALYSVTLHELTHWTGAPQRLNRTKGKKFGDKEYCWEELVAEQGAAYGCANLKISNEPRPETAAYLEHFIQLLKENKTAIISSAAEADKAVCYMDELQHKVITANFSQPRA